MDYNLVVKGFEDYASSFDKKNKDIFLKYNHSYKVAELMGELAFRLGLSKDDIIVSRTIGLLHDIGRFSQLKEFNSYSDKNIDHAEEGYRLLITENKIKNFGIPEKYYDVIGKAIRYHNKLSIPDGLSDRELMFAKMIRDMDKVDIYRVISVNFNYSFSKEKVDRPVIESFDNKKSAVKSDVKTDSDQIILTLCFLFDFNYNESLDILCDTDNFSLFISCIEVEPKSEEYFKDLINRCYDFINNGI